MIDWNLNILLAFRMILVTYSLFIKASTGKEFVIQWCCQIPTQENDSKSDIICILEEIYSHLGVVVDLVTWDGPEIENKSRCWDDVSSSLSIIANKW